ncbi:MAG: CoA transferase [Dehalococcoidia bacterium]
MTVEPGVLDGVRVIDLTRTTAGLFATMILGDLGAEVIKQEPREITPRTLGRFMLSERTVGSEDLRTIQTYRNKKSLILDIKSPLGKEVFYDLVRLSDVVIDNYRPGVMEKLGLDYDKLREINPRIICASITGFGSSGRHHTRPGFDYIAQAMTGLMTRTGEPGGSPLFPGIPIVDIGTGMFAAHGILAALYSRHLTGTGRRVETCLLDTALSFLYVDGVYYLNREKEPPPPGSKHWALPLPGVYQTSDGHIMVAAVTQEQTRNLMQALGREDILKDDRFDSVEKRVKNRRVLQPLVEEAFRTRPTAHWEEALKQADVPVSPVNTIEKAFADPGVQERDMVATVQYGDTPYRIIGNPIRVSGSPRHYTPPPHWGEHTEQILSSTLGYSKERMSELREKKVI